STFYPFASFKPHFFYKPGGYGRLSVESFRRYGDKEIFCSCQSHVGKSSFLRTVNLVSYLKREDPFDAAQKNDRPMLQPLCSVNSREMQSLLLRGHAQDL